MSQIKGKQEFMDINKTVNFILKNLIYLSVTGPREKIINELQKNVNDMSATIESLKGSLDRQEKYSSRNWFLIYGLPES